MRTGTIAIATALAMLVASALVLERKGQVLSDTPATAAAPAMAPEVDRVPAAPETDGLQAASEARSSATSHRSNSDTQPTATEQRGEPPVAAASIPNTSLSDPSGTPDAPGDPLLQPEETSEQFMHSRRGDGQHNE